eukprot:NODE_2553_length_915_cov_663.177907.p4 GENE.NODE_2553_length_915_cov_663.177907~~NODE_2553_length_915_cov_663.177907.p4  ORF type:complete len:121 (+),score=17.00 NODE_2553_length_915_cov_663.177907:281-643(+)
MMGSSPCMSLYAVAITQIAERGAEAATPRDSANTEAPLFSRRNRRVSTHWFGKKLATTPKASLRVAMQPSPPAVHTAGFTVNKRCVAAQARQNRKQRREVVPQHFVKRDAVHGRPLQRRS